LFHHVDEFAEEDLNFIYVAGEIFCYEGVVNFFDESVVDSLESVSKTGEDFVLAFFIVVGRFIADGDEMWNSVGVFFGELVEEIGINFFEEVAIEGAAHTFIAGDDNDSDIFNGVVFWEEVGVFVSD